MVFIAISNYLRVLIFAILLSFAEIAEINTRENMSPQGNRNQAALPIFFAISMHACGCNQASEIETFHFGLSQLDLPQTKKTKTNKF